MRSVSRLKMLDSRRDVHAVGFHDGYSLHRNVDRQFRLCSAESRHPNCGLQQQARDWWALERPKFSLVTSQVTLNEASTRPQRVMRLLRLIA